MGRGQSVTRPEAKMTQAGFLNATPLNLSFVTHRWREIHMAGGQAVAAAMTYYTANV